MRQPLRMDCNVSLGSKENPIRLDDWTREKTVWFTLCVLCNWKHKNMSLMASIVGLYFDLQDLMYDVFPCNGCSVLFFWFLRRFSMTGDEGREMLIGGPQRFHGNVFFFLSRSRLVGGLNGKALPPRLPSWWSLGQNQIWHVASNPLFVATIGWCLWCQLKKTASLTITQFRRPIICQSLASCVLFLWGLSTRENIICDDMVEWR